MAFQRPTLSEIIARVEGDINARVPNGDSRLRRSLLAVIARIVAGTAHGLYGFLDWLSRQIIADTAEDELLQTHASWWGVERILASPATGDVDFTGTDGTDIPAETVLQRADGVQFKTDSLVTIAAGAVTVSVTALEGGQASNTDAGLSLNLVTPIVGINSTATVASGGLTAGADIESIEALRQRLRLRVQQTPHGGATHDYIAWAKQVAGVTRAWSFGGWNGSGSVGLFFVRDDDASLIPDAGEIAQVQTHIDIVRPVTAAVTVYAPTESAQAMTIQISPNNATVQAAIQESLQDLFRNTAEVEGGNGEGKILVSHLREAISLAAGENDHILVSPSANITLNNGEIATLGAITWQAIP